MRDYLRGEGAASGFYQGSPFRLDSFRERLESVATRFGRAERARAAAALRPTSDTARERLERFVAEGGAMITTGQQAGLFGGPLYTVYKALTAVRLASELERQLSVPVLPVFWTASEDHDWLEVNHAFLHAEPGGLRKVELAGEPDRPTAMGDYTLGEQVESALDELAQVIGGEGGAADLLRLVRDAYRPEATVAGAFSDLLVELLSPFDMYLTDAAHPVVKEASAAALVRALEAAPRHESLLQQRTEEILAAGYHAQVAVLEGATNVFYSGSGARERLYWSEDDFVSHESRTRLPRREVADAVAAEPGLFSPNVFLRPVVESTVFPTLAYVGGPAELSYFAQLSVLFPEFGILPPVAYPRAMFDLVELPMQRLLEKLDVAVEDLARPRHELIEQLAQDAMPPEIRATLEELSEAISEGYRKLIENAVTIDPTLEGALARLRNEALVRVGDSERKVAQQLKRKGSVRIAQLDRLLANLRPEGDPQERVLNVLPFLARHGRDLLQRIADEVRVELR